jgi:3-oxoacyl-[acyl-carrier protein] reductase
LVTGANQGIGFTLAQALALDGLRVVVNGQRAEAVSAAVSTMREAGADVSGITGNVADESAVNRMFEEIDARFGRLDVVVNNAGIAPRVGGRSVRVEETPLDAWQQTVAVNRWGRIINMASQSGRMYTGFGSACYAATKSGLIGFSRVLAGEIGECGITVNCISPGRIKTAMAATFANEDEIDRQYIVRTPLRRVGTTDDVAGALRFLVSDAASFVTGTVIDVTGGFFMP